jgi:hypothetical protein
MNTITWLIEALDCKPQEGDLTDVVITAHWRCNGTDGTFNGTVYGTASMGQPSDPFTPFEELTEAQVIGWVQASLGTESVAAAEAAVAQQIANQVNPPVVTPVLPWAA